MWHSIVEQWGAKLVNYENPGTVYQMTVLGSAYQNDKKKLVAKNIHLGLPNHSLKHEIQSCSA